MSDGHGCAIATAMLVVLAVTFGACVVMLLKSIAVFLAVIMAAV